MRRRSAGFSVIELVLAIAMLAGLIGIVSSFQGRTRDQSQAWLAREKTESSARRALDRIAGELTGVGLTMLDPDPIGNLGASTLTYCRPESVSVAGVIVWANPSSLTLELEPGEVDDGDDDDGDGLIDERRLVLTRDVGTAQQTSVVLCTSIGELLEGEVADGVLDDNGNGLVDEEGFNVQRIGDLLTLRLTTQAGGGGGQVFQATVETCVVLRN
jgi:hypothetical protein